MCPKSLIYNLNPAPGNPRYGLRLMQLGYFRPDFQHPRYHNLYFVGASTRPSTGIPTTMLSGHQSAQRILDDLGIDAHSNGF